MNKPKYTGTNTLKISKLDAGEINKLSSQSVKEFQMNVKTLNTPTIFNLLNLLVHNI